MYTTQSFIFKTLILIDILNQNTDPGNPWYPRILDMINIVNLCRGTRLTKTTLYIFGN